MKRLRTLGTGGLGLLTAGLLAAAPVWPPAPFNGPLAAPTPPADFGLTTLRFQSGVDGYTGTVEVGLLQAEPNRSDAGEAAWIAFNATGATSTQEQQVLLQFRHLIGSGAGQIPPGASIHRATLELHSADVGGAQSLNRIFFHRMRVNWLAGATWGSSLWGGNGVQPNGEEAVVVPDANLVFPYRNRTYSVDVTESVQAWAGGEANHGWLLRSRLTDPAAITTSRAPLVSRRPALTVVYDGDAGNRRPTWRDGGWPGDRATGVPEPAPLRVAAEDADGDPLEATFWGRARSDGPDDISFILIPDTQYYVSHKHGGLPAMMDAQMDWIVAAQAQWNIAAALHLGDIVENGDSQEAQWVLASNSMARLEDPVTTGRPEGIPYAVCIGNHDQTPGGDPSGSTDLYNRYFGQARFAGRSTYGGSYSSSDNNNHYLLIDAGAMKFLILSLEFGRPRAEPGLLVWADGVLHAHPDRRVIVLAHHTMNPGAQGPFSADGSAIYFALRHHPHLFMILGGHITGEGWRIDEHAGSRVISMVQDFQFDANGGAGFLRILTLSPRRNEIQIRTYSPWLNEWRRDPASEFSLPYAFGPEPAPYVELGRLALAGGTANLDWSGLSGDTTYEWLAWVGDGLKTAVLEPRSLTTAPATYSDWAQHHGLDPDEPLDADGDGFSGGWSNRMDFLLGRVPRDGRVPQALEITSPVSGGGFVSFQRRSGTGYRITPATSIDLREWQRLPVWWESVWAQVQDFSDQVDRVTVSLSASAAPFWRLEIDRGEPATP